MKNEKRLAYQEKKISELEEQVKGLEQENKVLEQENASLRNVNDINRELIEKLKAEHDSILNEYAEGLKEIKGLRQKYTELIEAVSKTKKEYSNKMQILLRQLKKQVS